MATGAVENEPVPAAKHATFLGYLPTILYICSAFFAVIAVWLSGLAGPNISGIFVVLAAYSFFASHQLDKGDTNAQ